MSLSQTRNLINGLASLPKNFDNHIDDVDNHVDAIVNQFITLMKTPEFAVVRREYCFDVFHFIDEYLNKYPNYKLPTIDNSNLQSETVLLDKNIYDRDVNTSIIIRVLLAEFKYRTGIDIAVEHIQTITPEIIEGIEIQKIKEPEQYNIRKYLLHVVLSFMSEWIIQKVNVEHEDVGDDIDAFYRKYVYKSTNINAILKFEISHVIIILLCCIGVYINNTIAELIEEDKASNSSNNNAKIEALYEITDEIHNETNIQGNNNEGVCFIKSCRYVFNYLMNNNLLPLCAQTKALDVANDVSKYIETFNTDYLNLIHFIITREEFLNVLKPVGTKISLGTNDELCNIVYSFIFNNHYDNFRFNISNDEDEATRNMAFYYNAIDSKFTYEISRILAQYGDTKKGYTFNKLLYNRAVIALNQYTLFNMNNVLSDLLKEEYNAENTPYLEKSVLYFF